MRPLNLKEFAEQLRIEGNEFADEILELVTLQEDVADPYSELCDDLEHYAPDELKDAPARALEWLGDRSNLLADIEKLFRDEGMAGDVDDLVKQLLAELPAPPEYDL